MAELPTVGLWDVSVNHSLGHWVQPNVIDKIIDY